MSGTVEDFQRVGLEGVVAKAQDQPSVGARVVTSSTGGQKQAKREQFHTIPAEALFELSRLYEYGSSRYAPYNFRRGYDFSLSFDALQRHAWLWWNGEDVDPESGLSHMASVAWHALTLLMMVQSEDMVGEFDDRPNGPKADWGFGE